MEYQKKSYSTPQLIVHGDVEQLTLNGHQVNADIPKGNNNTAFSPGPG
jgi:hypothetical protein